MEEKKSLNEQKNNKSNQKNKQKKTQHNLYIQKERSQKIHKEYWILLQVTIKHSLQSVMYTWH